MDCFSKYRGGGGIIELQEAQVDASLGDVPRTSSYQTSSMHIALEDTKTI
jgi:hypothetical protein